MMGADAGNTCKRSDAQKRGELVNVSESISGATCRRDSRCKPSAAGYERVGEAVEEGEGNRKGGGGGCGGGRIRKNLFA